LKGVKRKSETGFIKESIRLILIKRIMKAQSKERMKRTAISIAAWRLRIEDRRGTGLDVKGPLVRNLVVKGVMERGLIDRGDIETNLIMMSLGTASTMQR
jgi:hypothetical protein